MTMAFMNAAISAALLAMEALVSTRKIMSPPWHAAQTVLWSAPHRRAGYALSLHLSPACASPRPPPPPPGWVGRDVGLQALSASSKALFNRTPHGARGIAWCKQLRNAYEKWSQNNAERAVQRRHTRSEVAVGAEASSANSAVDTHVREGVENECEARSAACTPNSGENTSDPTARTLYDPTRFHPNLNIE